MSVLGRCCCYGAILTCVITCIAAYQFDVDNIILYEDPTRDEKFRGSYFGYSVALWNTNSNNSWIFIGAPRANSTLYEEVIEPGTVFKCEIGELCMEWGVIGTKSQNAPHHGSWLGGSMQLGTDGKTDVLLVCAPRWQFNPDSTSESMKGMCYKTPVNEFSDSMLTMRRVLEPLQAAPPSSRNTKLDYTLGQSGFSIHIIPDLRTLQIVVGAPGAWYGHGLPILSNSRHWRNPSFIFPDYFDISNNGSVKNFSYSGYAVSSGHYFSASKRLYVSGVPRAEGVRGEVILFDVLKKSGKNQMSKWNGPKIIGKQIGEYFGSALATCDIDGDKIDDLLVGAPQWSKLSDEGRIYVFRGNNKKGLEDFKTRQSIDGETFQGRFGSAITCLGDIDFDGYDDVAVGAPYDGNGAVFIYHGGKNGLRQTQKICAPRDTKGFGISISESKDIDNNGYADIAVGAYASGHVTLFRSKRVVSMTVTLSMLPSEEPLKRDADSFLVNVCSSYEGKYPPRELQVTRVLKMDDIPSRAVINIEESRKKIHEFNDTLELDKLPLCKNFTIRINAKTEDFLHPLKLSVTQRLITINQNGTLLVKKNEINNTDHFDNSSAVTSGNQRVVQSHLEVPFVVECGNHGICNSSLSIHMVTDLQNDSNFVIGSGRIIHLNIEIANRGDPAYNTKVVVSIPNYIQLSYEENMREVPRIGDNVNVTLVVGNPLNQNVTKNISLALDMHHVPTDTKEIRLNATVTTQSHDDSSENHATSYLINCTVETDIGIAGNGGTERYLYSPKGKKEDLPNITFQQTYEIKNYAVTRITEALFSVSFPTHWIHGSKEIEVVNLNKTTGNLDNKEFYCSDTEENLDIDSLSSIPQADKNVLNMDNNTYAASFENQTLQINCTNPSFKCKTIHCKLEEFPTAKSAATLVLQFDLLLPNLTPEILQDRDTIFFATNASARLTMPLGITQSVNNKPDSILIGTKFVLSPPEHRLHAALIPASVFVGILLLILIIIGLFKFGFFKRTEKEKLEALLKENDNKTPKVVLETTSSTEALDMT